jgi:hypothetical protein
MKNVTLRADDHLIEKARQVAGEKDTTLNQAFRESAVSAIEDVYARLSHVDSGGRKYTREEMNQRYLVHRHERGRLGSAMHRASHRRSPARGEDRRRSHREPVSSPVINARPRQCTRLRPPNRTELQLPCSCLARRQPLRRRCVQDAIERETIWSYRSKQRWRSFDPSNSAGSESSGRW